MIARKRFCWILPFLWCCLSLRAGHGNALPLETNPEEVCAGIRNADLRGIQDAPTQISRTESVQASNGEPAFCKITGYVFPQVGFEMRLPASHWNGKLVVVGSGGWAGTVNGDACTPHIRRGYACVTSDVGHKGSGDDGLWAQSNLPAQLDFGFRAIHVATLAAKSIAERYYATAPSKSYFIGCSTGGYQGLVEAQRFPWDFDGILAGAPDMDEADLTMRQLWGRSALLDQAGKPILDTHAIEILHRAALEQCGKDDPARNGVIGNPLACAFDPSILLCRTGRSTECLSSSQVLAANKIYSGPPHSDDRPAIRGALPGSEMLWTDRFPGLASDDQGIDNFFRYMIYGAGPGWTSTTYDFEQDFKRLGLAALYTDTNPDLRRFKASGAKLIVYQGGNDVLEMPGAIVDYYQMVERVIGSRSATQDFFRLFMVPGMNHCVGGPGAWAIDYLSYLEAWVEQNRAPNEMIAAHVSDSYLETVALPEGWDRLLSADTTMELRNAAAAFALKLPLAANVPVTFTRPVYPYPFYAKYAGGDPNQATSFRAVQ
jgi:Tannase and feruloyl esterase